MTSLLTLIVLLPLAGFLANGLFGNRLGKRFVSVVGCGLPILAFAVTILCFLELQATGTPLLDTVYRWATIGEHTFDDQLGIPVGINGMLWMVLGNGDRFRRPICRTC